MSIFSRLFKRKKRIEHPTEEKLDRWEPDLTWEDEEESFPLLDDEQREKYVRTLLDQMRDASGQMDELAKEYNLVTGYLTDMEQIEALPEKQREELTDYAKRITHLDRERDEFQGQSGYLPEEEYRRVERLENEIKEGIRKLTEAEEYQKAVKRDLKRLETERAAYAYRRRELQSGMQNAKGICIIGMITVIVSVLMMLLLQFGFRLEVAIGYLLVAGAAAVFLTVIYVKYTDASREYKRIGNAVNKLILLQNRVKIRYVNNTNLLDYLYMKYEVESSEDLIVLWENYEKEREERERYSRTVADLEAYRKALINALKQAKLRDPYLWIHQPEALYDHKEMVEIRHGLMNRRQKLRKQMDYNREIATDAQKKIKKLMEQYPAFAKNILKFIDLYGES
ncbi:MAG: hypothetical protein ACI4F8_08210 [Lachnospiraceae bacterium]